MKTLALLALTASPAVAQQTCFGYADILANLAERHGEELASSGTTPDGLLVQTFGNQETGSWTILVVRPDGLACVFAIGGGFKQHRFKPNT